MKTKRFLIVILAAALLALSSFAASARTRQQSPPQEDQKLIAAARLDSAYVNQQSPHQAQHAQVAAPLAAAMRQYALSERYGETPNVSNPATCPLPNAASLSTQELRAMLDARYLHRIGQPR